MENKYGKSYLNEKEIEDYMNFLMCERFWRLKVQAKTLIK